MKRNIALAMIGVVLIATFATFVMKGSRSRNQIQDTIAAQTPHEDVLPVDSTNTQDAATLPQPASQEPEQVTPEQLPAGWKDFRSITESKRLERVTAAMNNRTLPADLLAFFEREIFNREHSDVTRNNMANALVWQETPNPKLHELFLKMLEDETENPVWRDYCLQFMSECMKSTSEPEVIKGTFERYSKGKDALAGTAIVQLAYQEGEGRLELDETFSKQLEEQLVDPDVETRTKLSILGVIGKRGDVRLLPVVRRYTEDKNDGLMRCALATLGQIGTMEDLPLIQAGMTHKNRAVQMAAKGAEERIRRRVQGEEK